MAKIWFLKAGEVHEGKFVADKPLDFCFDVLGLRVRNWHSPLEREQVINHRKQRSSQTFMSWLRSPVEAGTQSHGSG